MKKKLVFFITIKKSTKEIILQEGNLISLKIPQHWQKPDSNVKNPALWVCHLPTNSLGIKFISLYPSELIIKKEKWDKEQVQWEENELAETINEQELITYQGKLQPNGSNEEEEFYRCELSKVKKRVVVQDDGSSPLTAFFVFIIIIVVVLLVLYYSTKGNLRHG